MTQQKHVGSSLDDLLEADGTLEQVEAEALKRVIVWQIQQAMGQTGVNKSQLAQKMRTSRTVVNRLLDEKDTGVTITTLVKAGRALGMTWTLQAGEDDGSPRAACQRATSNLYWCAGCGCSSMAEQKLPKLTTRVRFPSPAPSRFAIGY